MYNDKKRRNEKILEVILERKDSSAPCPYEGCKGIIFPPLTITNKFAIADRGTCCVCQNEVLIKRSSNYARISGNGVGRIAKSVRENKNCINF